MLDPVDGTKSFVKSVPLWGTLIGGMVLGVAQVVGSQINPAYGVLVGHLVFLVILAFRPTGLLPKAVTT